ncbi:HSP20-like chaperone [Artemisia annua]|uniref:HSP20-like chaperone n=1 Tax=Artemisia annua TaxID=35608 RepID=A0A2U1MTR5_ARTAN|nr:HSP20-like chaperone [Artemisia annua]
MLKEAVNTQLPGMVEQIQFPGSGSDSQSPGHDEIHPATPLGENIRSEGNVGSNNDNSENVIENNEEVSQRRSKRTSNLPAKLNDYVLDTKVAIAAVGVGVHCTPRFKVSPNGATTVLKHKTMAMSRFILNNITHTPKSPFKTHTWTSQLVHRFSSTTDHHEEPKTKEISVSDSPKKTKLFSPKRRQRRSLWSSENASQNFPPLSGLANAFIDTAANMNKVLANLSPLRLIKRFKEKDESYSIKYQMPGLSKDDVKITVEDGMLFIRGERHEEEEGQGSDDEFWSAATYGYYNTSLMLPEDAKVEEIKAEMKDGVLHVIIPKDVTKKKHVKEIHVG